MNYCLRSIAPQMAVRREYCHMMRKCEAPLGPKTAVAQSVYQIPNTTNSHTHSHSHTLNHVSLLNAEEAHISQLFGLLRPATYNANV